MPSLAPEAMPPWRMKLLNIATQRRSPFQEDLVRGLELADFITEELKTPVTPSFTNTRAVEIIAAGVDAYLLGPLELSSVQLLDPSVRKKLMMLAFEMNKEAFNAANTHVSGNLTRGKFVPAALTNLLLGLIRVSYEQWERWGEVNFMLELHAEELELAGYTFVDMMLADTGSDLDAATLHEALLYVHYVGHLQRPRDLETARYVVEELVRPAAAAVARGEELPAWKVQIITRFHGLMINPLQKENLAPRSVQWGVRLGGSPQALQLFELISEVDAAVLAILKHGIREASADGDDARLAHYSGMLAGHYMNSLQQIKGSVVEATVNNACAALARARPWLPRTVRQEMSVEHLKEVFVRGNSFIFRSTAYYHLTGLPKHNCACKCGQCTKPVPAGPKTKPGPLPTLRTCAACGTQSQELMACAGCRAVYFCSLKCQKAHWKAGHKAQCKAMQAEVAAAASRSGRR